MLGKATAALLGLGTIAQAVAVPQDNASATTSARVPNATSGPGRYVPSAADLESGCANIGRVAASFVRTSASQCRVLFPR